MNIDRMFSGLNISANGLNAQRKRMNAIANNIANAETTRTEQGGPYRRQMVTFTENRHADAGLGMRAPELPLLRANEVHMPEVPVPFGDPGAVQGGVEGVATEDQGPFKIVYEPGHPDADENGYVRLPNVNIVTEMVDMISASRGFEANITAINAAKQMAKDSLEI